MKAIVQENYGSEDALRLREIDRPTIGDNDVLVRVHAASIHLGDRLTMAGRPLLVRMATGLRRPKQPVPGTDIAGTVEAVGSGVTRFKVGDEVFGWTSGAFAEFAAAPEDHLATKPARLTFEQAAAVGVSATTALQLLRDDGKIKPGQKVLINGASGGVGTYAVQIAKAFGAEVTGVASTRNVDLVRLDALPRLFVSSLNLDTTHKVVKGVVHILLTTTSDPDGGGDVANTSVLCRSCAVNRLLILPVVGAMIAVAPTSRTAMAGGMVEMVTVLWSGRRRGAVGVLVAFALLAATLIAPPTTTAHCPGGVINYQFAQGRQAAINIGVQVTLPWANPTVCTLNNGTGASLERITTCDWECMIGRDGWMQVGWMKKAGWTQPKGYCEFAASQGGSGFGGGTTIVEVPLAAGQYVYLFNWASDIHMCIINGLFRGGRSTAWAGFVWGDIVFVGGESQSTHSTIGVMAPAKYLLSNIRQYSNNAWNLVNVDPLGAIAFPYGADEPAVGQVRNWTVAH